MSNAGMSQVLANAGHLGVEPVVCFRPYLSPPRLKFAWDQFSSEVSEALEDASSVQSNCYHPQR